MKTIKLNENQFNRLMELNTTLGSSSPSTVKNISGEVSATAVIDDTNGNKTYGKPKTMDKVQKSLTNQGFLDGKRKW